MKFINALTGCCCWLIVACTGPVKNQVTETTSTAMGLDKVLLKDLNGKAIDVSAYAGKVVFINFWATWCKPCIQEMPSIDKAQTSLMNEQVVFLLASTESTEEINAFSKSNDYFFNYVQVENVEALQIDAIPTTYIFNKKGKLSFAETGARNWNDKESIDLLKKITRE